MFNSRTALFNHVSRTNQTEGPTHLHCGMQPSCTPQTFLVKGQTVLTTLNKTLGLCMQKHVFN